VLFGSDDVVCAADYASARAAERGWRGGGEAVVGWERGLRESSVCDMTCAHEQKAHEQHCIASFCACVRVRRACVCVWVER
jgi:hypothetical protein